MSAANDRGVLDVLDSLSVSMDDADGDALREARAAVAELIDSHARLLAAAEAAGWPKTAEQMMPMNEARRIAARIGGQS